MSELEPYRRNAFDDDKKIRTTAETLIGMIKQQAIDEELEVTKANIKIIRQHLSRVALENGGVIPIDDANEILDQFLRAEI